MVGRGVEEAIERLSHGEQIVTALTSKSLTANKRVNLGLPQHDRQTTQTLFPAPAKPPHTLGAGRGWRPRPRSSNMVEKSLCLRRRRGLPPAGLFPARGNFALDMLLWSKRFWLGRPFAGTAVG